MSDHFAGEQPRGATIFALQKEQAQVGLGNFETQLRLTQYSSALQKERVIEEAIQYYDPRGYTRYGKKGHLRVNPLTKDPRFVRTPWGQKVDMDGSKFAPTVATWPGEALLDEGNRFARFARGLANIGADRINIEDVAGPAGVPANDLDNGGLGLGGNNM